MALPVLLQTLKIFWDIYYIYISWGKYWGSEKLCYITIIEGNVHVFIKLYQTDQNGTNLCSIYFHRHVYKYKRTLSILGYLLCRLYNMSMVIYEIRLMQGSHMEIETHNFVVSEYYLLYAWFTLHLLWESFM